MKQIYYLFLTLLFCFFVDLGAMQNEDAQLQSHLLNLPEELICNICEHLDLKSFCRIKQSAKKIERISLDENLDIHKKAKVIRRINWMADINRILKGPPWPSHGPNHLMKVAAIEKESEILLNELNQKNKRVVKIKRIELDKLFSLLFPKKDDYFSKTQIAICNSLKRLSLKGLSEGEVKDVLDERAEVIDSDMGGIIGLDKADLMELFALVRLKTAEECFYYHVDEEKLIDRIELFKSTIREFVQQISQDLQLSKPTIAKLKKEEGLLSTEQLPQASKLNALEQLPQAPKFNSFIPLKIAILMGGLAMVSLLVYKAIKKIREKRKEKEKNKQNEVQAYVNISSEAIDSK